MGWWNVVDGTLFSRFWSDRIDVIIVKSSFGVGRAGFTEMITPDEFLLVVKSHHMLCLRKNLIGIASDTNTAAILSAHWSVTLASWKCFFAAWSADFLIRLKRWIDIQMYQECVTLPHDCLGGHKDIRGSTRLLHCSWFSGGKLGRNGGAFSRKETNEGFTVQE